ncbi:MAG: hypothetical protein H8F28_00245 [Fibrella sp.]|nr:hypothetical protein [Armatimonadota bacterium]
MKRIALFCPIAATVSVFLSGGIAISAPSSVPQPGTGEKRLTRFPGLGNHSRKITTAHPEAQRYFDQGLNFLFAFNHDEAIRSFQQAAAIDPDCAMAYWGIAISCGPHINFPMVLPDRAKTASDALVKATALAPNGTPAEKAMIDALGKRYADPQPENRRPLDEAYVTAMRSVWEQYPQDGDIGALFAESLMDLRPWDLYTTDGKPQPETPEILSVLESVLKTTPRHPLALHLYIHAVEAGPNPQKAKVAAAGLRKLLPGLGHMVHMPSHIDVRLGDWQQAVAANESAIATDRTYTRVAKKQDFYRVYKAHNYHMLAFAASMQGDSKRAIGAIRNLVNDMPIQWRRENPAFADGYLAMPVEVLMRFGRWQEILKEPEPDAIYPIARTLRHAGRGVAFGATNKMAAALAEQKAFRAAADRCPKDAFIGNNSAANIFAVVDALLEGELKLRQGKTDAGLQSLRKAVAAEDQLRYDEPPDWFYPTRHALGAALLQADHAAEAEAVYRADLKRWPENGWSLYGLESSLKKQGKKAEAAQVNVRYRKVWRHSDLTLTTSCLCLADKSAR